MAISIQEKIDNFWQSVLFSYLPKQVNPNFFTWFRIFLIPFVLYFLIHHKFYLAGSIFLLTAILDIVDGSLARIRNQTSYFGAVLDSTADKLLIASIAVFLFLNYPYPALILLSVIFDFVLLIFALLILITRVRKIEKADWTGKIKMILQMLSYLAVILYFIIPGPSILIISMVLLVLATIFGFSSLVSYSIKML